MLASATADHWAVIVAGSNGYGNYRHQADACHAYQVFRSKGIPESNIITMAYDDVAGSRSNPFRGKLFNKPDPSGPGVDVYEGCKLDYTKKEVTPKNFANVLTGQGSGKVLKSTEEDEVFVTFFDHGAVGLIAFPGMFGPTMHKQELQSALQTMHDQKMYKKLVFYLESCESGSMFEGLDIPGVYALSAAGPDESSWGTYCGSDAKVNGKSIGSCLGDLFSVNWMEDDDAKDTTKETLDAQFQVVKNLTDKSKVMQWGDVSFKGDFVSQYIGNQDGIKDAGRLGKEARLASSVSARQLDLHRWFQLYTSAESSQQRMEFGREMQAELKRQQAAETAFRRFAQIAYPHDEEAQEVAWTSTRKPDHPECEIAGHKAFAKFCGEDFDANSAFALQFHRVVVHVCADVADGLNLSVSGAVQQACGQKTVV